MGIYLLETSPQRLRRPARCMGRARLPSCVPRRTGRALFRRDGGSKTGEREFRFRFPFRFRFVFFLSSLFLPPLPSFFHLNPHISILSNLKSLTHPVPHLPQVQKDASNAVDSITASSMQMQEVLENYRASADVASKNRVREALNAALQQLPDWPPQNW